jgi:sugar lactone lactonase YvrE
LRSISRSFLFIAIIALLFFAAVEASNTRRWIQGGREEFLKGDPESASISSDGGIVLPPLTTKVFDSKQQFVWDLVIDNKGQLYAAGGTEGIIYDARGNPVHDNEKPEIRALALAPDGRVYFATGPSGSIMRLGATGTAEEFYTPKNNEAPPERYVWDMAFDAAGNLYVATGIEGRLYKVSSDGNGTVVFDSDETHLTALAIDGRGGVVFGSDPDGQVFRLDSTGKVFVIYDSPLREISDIAIGPDGSIFATAISDEAGKEEETKTGEKREAPISASTAEVGSNGSGGSVSVAKATDAGETDGEISALYHISPDGAVSTLWSSKTEIAYSLAVDRQGTAYLGTGPNGRLIAVEADGSYRIMRRLEGMQITTLLDSPGQLYAGVSNLGMVFKISRQFAERGTYISQVEDTGTVSSFGAIRWRAQTPTGTSVRLLTRSGNTEKPDNTWSDWSTAYTDPLRSTIASPSARFVQWKAELSTTEPGATPVLQSVSIFYLQDNLKPRVKAVTVLPPGAYFKPSPPNDMMLMQLPVEAIDELKNLGISVSLGSTRGQMDFSREMRTIIWDATDSNGDDLVYRVLVRPAGESDWSPLASGIEDQYFCFDSRTLADGEYVIRVEASDGPSNPPERALAGSLDTKPFVVDNTPPSVVGLAVTVSGRKATVTFNAVDDSSTIRAVRVRVDAEPWQAVLPSDGIADSARESISASLDGLEPGRHTITVQVMDELHNVGSGSAEAVVK